MATAEEAAVTNTGQKRKKKVTSAENEDSPKKKKPKKALDSRFGGRTEEEIMELLLPDHLQPDLDIVFIGINPGLLSAHLGHHYCNSNNHFWPCMFESGLIPHKMTYKEDAECLNYGIGFTNIVPRTTRSSNDLTKKEIQEWSLVMIERMKELKPLVACFNGKGIYEIFTGKKCVVGIQPDNLPGTQTVVYVMPSTSGRAASHPRRVDKLKFFHELKQLRDRIKLERGLTTTLDSSYPNLAPPQKDSPTSGDSSSHTAAVTIVKSHQSSTSASPDTNPQSNKSTSLPSVVGSHNVTQQGDQVGEKIITSPYFPVTDSSSGR